MRRLVFVMAVLSGCSSGEGTVAVEDPPARCFPGAVTVAPQTVTLAAGDTARLKGQLEHCRVAPDTLTGQGDLIWTSSSPAVATVDSMGFVRGLATGAVTIRAAWRRDYRYMGASQVLVR